MRPKGEIIDQHCPGAGQKRRQEEIGYIPIGLKPAQGDSLLPQQKRQATINSQVKLGKRQVERAAPIAGKQGHPDRRLELGQTANDAPNVAFITPPLPAQLSGINDQMHKSFAFRGFCPRLYTMLEFILGQTNLAGLFEWI